MRSIVLLLCSVSTTYSQQDTGHQLPSPGAVHSPPPGSDTKLPQFDKSFNKDASRRSTTQQDQREFFHKDLNPYTKPVTRTLEESTRS